MAQIFSCKYILLLVYIASVSYMQLRGRVRLKFFRQLINHSTFIAPLNALMYLFSKVPNKPFQNVREFPALTVLSDNWQIIRAEAQQLVAAGYIKVAENNNDLGFNSFFKRGWKRFYLKWYQNFLPSAELLCPATVALLKQIPGIHGAMFTLLPRGGQLKPHRDPYAGTLRYHLGLITPNDESCRIYVDGEPYHWRDGESVLFDETFIHSAKNDSDIDRIILFCDVERPLNYKWVTAINQIFCKYVMSQSATQNLASDKVGMFNQFYKYYNYAANQLQRLKKSNRFIYSLLQYTSLAGLVYWAFF
jgi:beta-hydroxylase